jgi:hypothetical protein
MGARVGDTSKKRRKVSFASRCRDVIPVDSSDSNLPTENTERYVSSKWYIDGHHITDFETKTAHGLYQGDNRCSRGPILSRAHLGHVHSIPIEATIGRFDIRASCMTQCNRYDTGPTAPTMLWFLFRSLMNSNGNFSGPLCPIRFSSDYLRTEFDTIIILVRSQQGNAIHVDALLSLPVAFCVFVYTWLCFDMISVSNDSIDRSCHAL